MVGRIAKGRAFKILVIIYEYTCTATCMRHEPSLAMIHSDPRFYRQ
jgi:hypothetical protein